MATRRNTSTLNGTFTGDRCFPSSVVSADARRERILRETATANGPTVLPCKTLPWSLSIGQSKRGISRSSCSTDRLSQRHNRQLSCRLILTLNTRGYFTAHQGQSPIASCWVHSKPI